MRLERLLQPGPLRVLSSGEPPLSRRLQGLPRLGRLPPEQLALLGLPLVAAALPGRRLPLLRPARHGWGSGSLPPLPGIRPSRHRARHRPRSRRRRPLRAPALLREHARAPQAQTVHVGDSCPPEGSGRAGRPAGGLGPARAVPHRPRPRAAAAGDDGRGTGLDLPDGHDRVRPRGEVRLVGAADEPGPPLAEDDPADPSRRRHPGPRQRRSAAERLRHQHEPRLHARCSR